MALIPVTDKFHLVDTTVDTTNRGSAQANSLREAYTMQDVIDTVGNTGGSQPVATGLIAQGTSNATTSIMSYGVNVFSTSTSTNYATKLPQPITGQSVTVINESAFQISVFPSNVGGDINNLPVDTPLVIPADGLAYQFICTENPLPGGWNVISPPATTQYELSEISVAHTNATDTFAYGYGGAGQLLASTSQWLGAVTSTFGAGNISLLPSPGVDYWLNIPGEAVITKVKLYTNFVVADGANAPILERFVTYMSAINNLVGATVNGSSISLNTPEIVPVGTLNSPPEIGDTGTYYKEAFTEQDPLLDSMGTGTFSPSFQMIAIRIPATAATKTYKFKVILEYVV